MKSEKLDISNLNLETKQITTNKGTTGDTVILKENGEQSVIVNTYGVYTIKVSFDNLEGIGEETLKLYKQQQLNEDNTKKKDGWYYTLENGNNIHEDDVIVGKDDIRDYKIKKIEE